MAKNLKQQNPKQPGSCVFCGGGAVPGNPMTGEHLWSNWIDKAQLLPSGGEYDEIYQLLLPQQKKPVLRIDQSRQGSATTKKIKVVCKNCNSGWMGDIETQVKPFLSPLIAGQPIILTTEIQKILAKWIVLKVLVVDNLSYRGRKPDPVFDKNCRKKFMENNTIPPGFRIWIAPQNGIRWEVGFFRHVSALGVTASLPPANTPRGFGNNTQAITWGLGK